MGAFPKTSIGDTFLIEDLWNVNGGAARLRLRVVPRKQHPMRLTTYTDYALRVLMYVGLRRDRVCTIKEIADAYGISRNHLMKVVHRLSTFGYLESGRGKGGGLRLARPPEGISIGAVVRDTEDDLAVVPCLRPGPSDCSITAACGLRPALRAATDAFLNVLDHYSLADLLRPSRQLGRLLALSSGADKPHAVLGDRGPDSWELGEP
jgi:Rrf2 family nitric oxide-sensitive transcriptional repressor